MICKYIIRSVIITIDDIDDTCLSCNRTGSTLKLLGSSEDIFDPRPSTNQSTSLKSSSLFLLMVSVRPSVCM